MYAGLIFGMGGGGLVDNDLHMAGHCSFQTPINWARFLDDQKVAFTNMEWKNVPRVLRA